jgi:chromosome segregation ATPase
MARKQTQGKEGGRGKQGAAREKPPSATATGRMLLILETIETQNRSTSEAVSATRNELRRDLADFRAEVDGRFKTLEAAIRHNSRGIRELKGDMQELKAITADQVLQP